MEDTKRNPTGPILIVAAGLAVILIAFLIWAPWKDANENPSADSGDTTEATQAVDEPETTAEEEETTADEGEDEDSDGGEDEEQTTEEETTEEEPEVVDLDDYRGWDVNEAVDQLESDGFTDVTASPTAPESSDHATCEVLYQTPESGTEVGYDTPIEFAYVANDDSCPDGNMESE
jgi:serine/threonine-protein kinase